MNINNFEEHFDETILARGLDYYQSENIISLQLYDGNEWIAKVEGSDDYTVSVTLSEAGEILYTECDCPYDWGDFCKHQAAVFYALRKKLKIQKKSSKPLPQKRVLEKLLEPLSKQELAELMLEFAKKDKRIKEELFRRFSSNFQRKNKRLELLGYEIVKQHDGENAANIGRNEQKQPQQCLCQYFDYGKTYGTAFGILQEKCERNNKILFKSFTRIQR